MSIFCTHNAVISNDQVEDISCSSYSGPINPVNEAAMVCR